MPTDSPQTILRTDYRPPVFAIESIAMGFDLDPVATTVASRLRLVRQQPGVLHLDGEGLELLFIEVDGRRLTASEYQLDASGLSLPGLPDRCTLDIAVRNRPADNSSLMGLYVSGGNFFTQCEAEGFRKITYFPDRPDVMTRFTVMLRASKKQYPVLLSNGNLIDSGDLGDGRHYAKWEDPFLKPCYLFALVAGKLKYEQRKLTTASGRDALLQIYVEKRDLKKIGHAMDSLVNASRWDEQRFGLELDLDRFMVVAVGDFNMGAMENKGLNIFNTKYVLASPQSATDIDFANIEAVIGHEYFHNWTGNRVTCRDWFQLTLKEGLTVFRDQEFSADMAAGLLDGRDDTTARAVKRIDDVRGLRAGQFAEDAGPMAHPVRPESYQEISNFYTATVYEKGAEVIRMLATLLGRDGFRAGMDEYFRRHDGQAVTCDDFVAAMESVYTTKYPGRDLQGFRRWYEQAGTPRVAVKTNWNAKSRRYTVTLRQTCPKVGVERQGNRDKLPFHIPFAIGLVDPRGQDLPLRLSGESAAAGTTRVLDFTEAEQQFVFLDVAEAPVPSLLRHFSAPVNVDHPYTDAQLAHLSAHDSDAFNRWEAGQRLATRELARLAALVTKGQMPAETTLNPALTRIFGAVLADPTLDAALKELALTLPAENVVGETLAVYDPQAVHVARVFARRSLAQSLRAELLQAVRLHETHGPYSPDPVSAGRRALRSLALGYLMELDDSAIHQMVWRTLRDANNMTEQLAALGLLVNHAAKKRDRAIDRFYRDHRKDPLVVDKWLRVLATAREVGAPVLDTVSSLLAHKAYAAKNPNKIYSLLGAFFIGNPAGFHRPDGTAYAFWAEQVLKVDSFNPQVAARLARALDRWKKLTAPLQEAAHAALLRVQGAPNLSRDVAEVIGKALAA
jgi:aminopeptidase N